MGGTEGEAVEDDLRGDIESAFDNDGGAADEGEAGQPGGLPPPDPASAPASAAPPAEGSGKPAPTRDSMGRFLPKEAIPAPAAPSGTLPPAQPLNGQPAPAQAPAQAIPAPAGFGFSAKEAWAQVPAAVQQEVARRENDVMRFIHETGPVRQLGESFRQVAQRYMGAIQAEGVDPITAADNLFQWGARMRMGTPNEKATTVANMCKAYGVDLQALDSALAGIQLPQAGNDPQSIQRAIQQGVQQELLPLYQAAQQRKAQLEESAREYNRQEIAEFGAQPEHKYLEHLRDIMADLVEAAQARGAKMSLEDAYGKAAMLHPEISKLIIAQRQGANAQQLTAAAQRARAAAVSVNGSAPIGNPNPSEPTSVRESIEAAIEAHSRY